MAELQRLLQQNGSFKSEMMQAFMQSAHQHQRNNSNDNQNNKKNSQGSRPSLSETGSYTSTTTSGRRDETDIRNRNQSIATNVGIIEEGLDNFKADPNNPTLTDNNTTLTASKTSSESTTTGPKLDNSQFSKTDNKMPAPQTVPNAASPMKMPEMTSETMMFMPEMMSMMKDMDPSKMMSGGMPPMPPPEMMAKLMPDADDNANQIDVERILETVKQVPSALRQQLIDHVIDTIGQAHMETVTPTREKVAEANKNFARKMAEGQIPDFSKMSIQPNMMWQKFVANMVFEVTQAIRFCKKLPGFADIKQADQITLVKKGSFEILLNRMCLLVDHVKQEMFDPSMEMKCPRDMVVNMPMGFFIKEFFNVAAQINPLSLTDVEVGIFSASLIMSPDRESLDNVGAIEILNTLFLQALYFEMRKNHNDFENKFARLLGIIPVFKMINQKHTMALNAMKMKKDPVMEVYPALPKEIYDA